MAFNVENARLCFEEVNISSNCTGNRESVSAAKFTPLVDDATLHVFLIVNSLVLSFVVMVLGVSTNIINILVFAKLGFTDTTNISLTALAISDLASLLVKLPLILLNPILLPHNLTFNPLGVHFMVVGVPYTWLSRCTSWLTVYIVLERYLCVMTPLKVKTMITPHRSVLVIVVIFVTMAVAAIPTYYTNRLEWIYNPALNRTILDLVSLPGSSSATDVSYPVLQLGSFFAVVAVTTALVTKLAEKSEWRKKMATKTETVSRRDLRVARMIIFICIIFIVCYIPMTTSYVWTIFDPEFSSAGLHKILHNVIVVSASQAQGINSSINLFVYLKMSTKYREMFYTLFRKT